MPVISQVTMHKQAEYNKQAQNNSKQNNYRNAGNQSHNNPAQLINKASKSMNMNNTLNAANATVGLKNQK